MRLNVDAGTLRLTLSVGSITWYDDYAVHAMLAWADEFVYGSDKGQVPDSISRHHLRGPVTATLPGADPFGVSQATHFSYEARNPSKNTLTIALRSTWETSGGSSERAGLEFSVMIYIVGGSQRYSPRGDTNLVTLAAPAPGAWRPASYAGADAGYAPVTEEQYWATGRWR
jgi:hypothetical protein